MKLQCFGSRGSISAPSCKALNFYTDKYGGNTTCYYLEAGDFKVILDMGSGAKNLGDFLMKKKIINQEFLLLLSHYHSDHIQGIGFHIPFYIPTNTFHIHGFVPTDRDVDKYNFIERHVEHCLTEQQSSPYFPVPHSELPAIKKYYAHKTLFSETFLIELQDKKLTHKESSLFDETNANHLLIQTIPLNHPNGCLGYKITHLNKTFAFCTDNEPLAFTNKNINKIAKNVDLLVLDGQYTSEQISSTTQGFGHGTPELCIKQGIDCGAKKLIIHHHEPNHDDNTIDLMFEKLKDQPINFCFAKEGDIWEV